MNKIILHSDLNNFYASVECLFNPDIQGKPVVVGGDEESRHGVVLAKNEIAKKYGIKSAESIWQAKQKCNNLIVVPPHFERYSKYSKMTKEIYYEYTNQVESFGLDECWLDVTGSTQLFGDGKEIADKIRQRIKAELGLTVSIGVSFNKVFAKLGSDLKKPDATSVITKENFKDIVWKLPVNELLYVGKATYTKLKQIGICTIGDLASANPVFLKNILGKSGYSLWRFANGMDDAPVADMGDKTCVKSVSNSTTTPKDLVALEEVKIVFYKLAESVASRLREQGLKCTTVQIGVKDNSFVSYERQKKLEVPTFDSNEIFKAAMTLFVQHHKSAVPVRSLGVRACNLIGREYMQLSIFEYEAKVEKHEKVEKMIDEIRTRFGSSALQRGVMLVDQQLTNLHLEEE